MAIIRRGERASNPPLILVVKGSGGTKDADCMRNMLPFVDDVPGLSVHNAEVLVPVPPGCSQALATLQMS